VVILYSVFVIGGKVDYVMGDSEWGVMCICQKFLSKTEKFVYKILLRKPEGNRPLGRPKHSGELSLSEP
jgi:hypothetical protein